MRCGYVLVYNTALTALKWRAAISCCGKLQQKVLVWASVSEVWEPAGYLDYIQYYPAVLEVQIEDLEGYC